MSYAAQSKPRISSGEFWVLPTIFALMLSGCIGLLLLGIGLDPHWWLRIGLVVVGLYMSQVMAYTKQFSEAYWKIYRLCGPKTNWLISPTSTLLSLAGAAIGMLIAVGIMSYA